MPRPRPPLVPGLALLLAGLVAAPATARAQGAPDSLDAGRLALRSAGTHPSLAPPPALAQPQRDEPREARAGSTTLTGDWGGLRPGLDRRGVGVTAVHTADGWVSARGARGRRTAHLHNIEAALSVDGERLVGWRGATLFVSGLGHFGSPLRERVGDAQGTSNIEAPRAWRLYEAWLEQGVGAGSLRVGMYDLNSEFYSGEAAALFLNSAHGIGPEIAQVGPTGPSIFPRTSVGARLRVEPGRSVYLQAVVLDGVPGDPERPEATVVRWSAAEGILAVAEVGRRHDPAGTGRPLKVALGGWLHTGDRPDLAATEADGEATLRSATFGAYVVAEGGLRAEAGDPAQGLAAFGRLGVADARANALGAAWGAGLAYTGLLPGRDADRLGVAVAAAHNGAPFLRAQRSLGTPHRAAEVAMEATYRARITPWLLVQPDVQWIVSPGMAPGAPAALAFAARAELTF